MAKTIVVYGLSTEGYAIASRMAIKGATVYIIDESTPSAINLRSEIAKTYPNVSSLKEDEPLLALEPINTAISKADYLFFTPCIRPAGQDIKIEITSKFKDAIASMSKNSSVIYALPTGFGGNEENISILEYMTGMSVGTQISYFYYPLSNTAREPDVMGSFDGKKDQRLQELLSGKKAKKFISISSSEYHHAINILTNFSRLCSILEVCKLAKAAGSDLSSDTLQDIYLDDMVNCLFDLKSLGYSSEGPNQLMYLINGSIKGIDNYIKRLTDSVRSMLKQCDLKASKARVALSWTFDQHGMRNDKMEIQQSLTTRLRDYIGVVELFEDNNPDMFHSEKTRVVIACSKQDYANLAKLDSNIIIVKANSFCEVILPTH